jgi:hypothetical protein
MKKNFIAKKNTTQRPANKKSHTQPKGMNQQEINNYRKQTH